MKVTRVFCYSKDVAKQYKNTFSIFTMFLGICLALLAFVFVFLIGFEYPPILLLGFIGLITFFVFFGISINRKMRAGLSGFAITEDNRLFQASIINNGQGLYLGGVAIGSIIDQLANNSSNVGSSIGGTIGSVAQLYSINRSINYMEHPEIVAKMVEEAPNISGAIVTEILKVHSIIDNGKSIKINCDTKIVGKDNINYNKNILIKKAYIQFNDLVNILNMIK